MYLKVTEKYLRTPQWGIKIKHKGQKCKQSQNTTRCSRKKDSQFIRNLEKSRSDDRQRPRNVKCLKGQTIWLLCEQTRKFRV